MGRFRQVSSGSWVVERLSDGSMAIFDQQTKGSFFLNATAAAAWEACKDQADAASVARSMSAALKKDVSVEAAGAALAALEAKHLVESSDTAPSSEAVWAGRRRILQTAGAAAGAVVLALTAGEQKALAFQAGSLL